jgi:hypothetical protein
MFTPETSFLYQLSLSAMEPRWIEGITDIDRNGWHERTGNRRRRDEK